MEINYNGYTIKLDVSEEDDQVFFGIESISSLEGLDLREAGKYLIEHAQKIEIMAYSEWLQAQKRDAA